MYLGYNKNPYEQTAEPSYKNETGPYLPEPPASPYTAGVQYNPNAEFRPSTRRASPSRNRTFALPEVESATPMPVELENPYRSVARGSGSRNRTFGAVPMYEPQVNDEILPQPTLSPEQAYQTNLLDDMLQEDGAPNVADAGLPAPDVFGSVFNRGRPDEAGQRGFLSRDPRFPAGKDIFAPKAGVADSRMGLGDGPSQAPSTDIQGLMDALNGEGSTPKQRRDAERLAREAEFGMRKSNIGDRAEGRMIVKGLQQQGVTEDQIRAELSKSITDASMDTPAGRLRVVRDMQNKIRAREEGLGVSTKTRERFEKNAIVDDEGNPNNQEARGADLVEWMDSGGVDPTTGSNREYMNKSQLNRFNKIIDRMSMGKATNNDERELNNMRKSIDKRRTNAYAKKQEEMVMEKHKADVQRIKDYATNSQQRSVLSQNQAQWRQLKSNYDSVFESEGKDSENTKNALDALTSFDMNQGIAQAGTPDKFGYVAGMLYKDDDTGDSDRYLGNGKWESGSIEE